ncbi:hypothetical protein A3Q56_05013 [Intoshia linei]|uniref:GIY-YIG domain-containing protein n=1 Tax=Intoshia linei TaxID=1819745 RepID=A0A177AZ58_9BILA|nr:hypothetical protein A3Q56_05013 [Intoshia linei]
MSKLDMTNYSSSSDEEILLTQIPKYADIKNFNGCYLLYSLNEKYLGKTYIGYTVNPYRRVRQHNRLIKGGASKTLRAGPWDMILIIYGFPNNVSALRFEWAWQNPKKSRRLTQIPPKKRKETEFIYKYRIMLYMLNIGPWCRLPLSFCWLKPDYKIQIINANVDLKVPIHMDVTEIGIKNNEWLLKPKQISDTCFICQKTLSVILIYSLFIDPESGQCHH